MSDFERYGDYNSVDEEERSPSLLGKIFKILVIILLVSVCLVLACRLIISGYYPRSMKSFYMTDALKDYQASHVLQVEELEIDVPFDDSEYASFCAANLFVERAAGAMQFSVRFTDSTFRELADRLSLKDEPDYSGRSRDYFDFSLIDNLGNRYHPTYCKDDSYFWYHATKLCFDAVNFHAVGAHPEQPDTDLALAWIRLDVYYTGGGEPDYSEDPYAMIPIYVLVSEIVQQS